MMETHHFKSSRNKSTDPADYDYTTMFDRETGHGHCDCPGWRFFRYPDRPGYEVPPALRVCTHLKQLRAGAALPLSGPAATETPVDDAPTRPEPTVARIRPMLATDMPDEMTIDDFEGSADWFAQLKYDGFRQLVRKSGATVTNWGRPRKGETKPRRLPARIYDAFRAMPDGVYDGEIYVPGGTSSDVQTWLAAARVDRPSNPLRFVVYDVLELHLPGVDPDVAKRPQEERTEACALAVLHYTTSIGDDAEAMVTAEQTMPVSRNLYNEVRKAGGEGLVLKRRSGIYRSGWRSTDWIKVKPEFPITVTTTGYEAGSFGPYSKILCALDDGGSTSVKTRDSKLRKRIADNPDAFLQRRAVLHYTERTPKGGLRHPRFEYFVGESD